MRKQDMKTCRDGTQEELPAGRLREHVKVPVRQTADPSHVRVLLYRDIPKRTNLLHGRSRCADIRSDACLAENAMKKARLEGSKIDGNRHGADETAYHDGRGIKLERALSMSPLRHTVDDGHLGSLFETSHPRLDALEIQLAKDPDIQMTLGVEEPSVRGGRSFLAPCGAIKPKNKRIPMPPVVPGGEVPRLRSVASRRREIEDTLNPAALSALNADDGMGE